MFFFALETQNCLCLDPKIPCYDSGWFSAFQFVPPTPKKLAEIKTTIFCNDFCLTFFQLELSHNAI